MCSGLDALVQAALKADPTAPYLARRLFETWKTLGDRVVQVGCGELEMHGEIGLRANSRRGGWILPAHLAGLRRVTMLEWAAFRDVERLGHVLALRNTDEQALHQLWKRLWSGDAPGFALELEEPVHEARDHVEAATSPACRQLQFEVAVEAWSRRASDARNALTSGQGQAVGEWLTGLEQHLASATAGPDWERHRSALAASAADTRRLLEAEVNLVLEHPALRAATPPEQLAARIGRWLRGDGVLDRRSIHFLCKLAARGDAYSSRVLASLDDVATGEAAGQQLRLEGLDAQQLAVALERVAPATAQGWVHGLLLRAAGEGLALELVASLFRRWGAQTFGDFIEPSCVRPSVAAGLCWANRDQVEHALLVEFVSRLPPTAAATAFAAMPSLIDQAQAQVQRLLVDHPTQSVPLVRTLAAQGTAGARPLQQALLQGQARDWPARLLRATFSHLVESGLGESLVPLLRARPTSTEAKLALLDALEDDRTALQEALRFRPGQMLEAPEVRDKLARLRRRVKA